MSLDIRYVTNGKIKGYLIRDALSIKTVFVKTKEEIPESIRHYAPDGEPKFYGPDMARIMGCQSFLYPNFPTCQQPEYLGRPCIAESCIYADDGDWTMCPYFPKKEG